jgi:hypothetical protein
MLRSLNRWRNLFLFVAAFAAVAGFVVALVGCDQLPTSLPFQAPHVPMASPEERLQELTNYRLQSPGFKRIIIGSSIAGSSLLIMAFVGLCCKNYETTVLPA